VRRDLVAQLPQVSLNVLDLPGELQRQLFDAFQLEIRYDRHRQQVTIKVAIRAEMIDSIGRTSASLAGQVPTVPRQRRSTETETTDRAGAPAPARNFVPCLTCPRLDTSQDCSPIGRLMIVAGLPVAGTVDMR